uniref:ATP synthase F0 subunit 8 n=1 Tax=Panagrolaimus sp. ES5 TaxID=591445 RepID=A0AC34F8U6_9BILA
MVNLDLPLNHRENANLIYGISYFYTVLVAALIWSIWRFVRSILSLKPKNIKKQVEKRLARHYAERRRYRQNLQQQKNESNSKNSQVESQQQLSKSQPEIQAQIQSKTKNVTTKKDGMKTEKKAVEKE